ncbi:MAG: sensor domain-containing diguanylate cyclase [Polyangiaceae bacterium]|nr:sensor domain-containing diguanylate cyclase [Polyangiaceae bacterium]
MDTLVALVLGLRRALRRIGPFTLAAVLGAFSVLDARWRPHQAVSLGIAGAIAAAIVWRALRRRSLRQADGWRDAALGMLVVLGCFDLVTHLDGSLDGRFYPVVYLGLAAVSAFAHPLGALAAVAFGAGLELALRELAFGGLELSRVAPHAAFALAFGVLNIVLLRVEMARLRRASHGELRAELRRVQEEAESYRLLQAPRETAHGDEERLVRSAVEEIRLSVLFALTLLREALGLHTAVLLWLDEGRGAFRISELSSDDGDLAEGPFGTGSGILGAVLAQRAPVALADIHASYSLPYYRGPAPVGSVAAVPGFEHGRLRCVLVADRLDRRAFSARELGLVEQAARLCVRAVRNERVFAQLERTKVDQGKLYRAAQALAAATSEAEVVDAAVASAREIAHVDFAACTALDRQARRHEIRALSGDGVETLRGQRFDDNTGLVSMALKSGHALPYKGIFDAGQQVVFGKDLAPPPMPSLLVLPLFLHDEPLGTLVLGSRTPGGFGDGARALLDVLASHVAVSLSNARLVRKLEEQATTDGLTGALNKRALLDTARDRIAAAKRFGRRLSVLVTDIDHFKRVNDTYGHDAGDVVIKELAQIHIRAARTNDAVARFGGEEFVVVCDETDERGALQLAERIRAELGKKVFKAATGESFQCTCSVGIATFPDAGATWEQLFKAADAALYASKRGGRNRATLWSKRHHVAA